MPKYAETQLTGIAWAEAVSRAIFVNKMYASLTRSFFQSKNAIQ